MAGLFTEAALEYSFQQLLLTLYLCFVHDHNVPLPDLPKLWKKMINCLSFYKMEACCVPRWCWILILLPLLPRRGDFVFLLCWMFCSEFYNINGGQHITGPYSLDISGSNCPTTIGWSFSEVTTAQSPMWKSDPTCQKCSLHTQHDFASTQGVLQCSRDGRQERCWLEALVGIVHSNSQLLLERKATWSLVGSLQRGGVAVWLRLAGTQRLKTSDTHCSCLFLLFAFWGPATQLSDKYTEACYFLWMPCLSLA